MNENKKYKPGNPIKTMDDLVNQEFVFLQGRLYHRGWFMSWQLNWANAWLRKGRIKYAVKVEVEQ